jgi:anti-sigma28 factor (negative regulator of flagellin synthesis)
MKIGLLQNELPMRQPDRPKVTSKETTPERQISTDRVEISNDARTKLAELADLGLKAYGTHPEERLARPDDPTGTEKDRISEIRQKIESGFYDRPEIRDQIANNLTDDLTF